MKNSSPKTVPFSSGLILTTYSYFINDEDEIRNIKDPKYYFKYFIDRNAYYNDSQRFSFNSLSFFFPQWRCARVQVSTD